MIREYLLICSLYFMDAADDCFLLDVRPTDKTGQQALDIMTAPNKKYTAETDITSTGTAY